jgi:hypothetical protein
VRRGVVLICLTRHAKNSFVCSVLIEKVLFLSVRSLHAHVPAGSVGAGACLWRGATTSLSYSVTSLIGNKPGRLGYVDSLILEDQPHDGTIRE